MQQPETRPSLIARIKGPRNEQAWTEFVCAYEPFLLRLIERQGTPPHHAHDVAQQIFIAIAKSVEGWKDDGNPASFRRWLGRVARNCVVKFMTRERRQIAGQGGSDFLDLIENAPDEAAAKQDEKYDFELILWAAERVRCEFRETSWKAFMATEVEGRSVPDVATELGVSPGSIYMSRSRIMARIRKQLAKVAGNETLDEGR